MGVRFGRAPPHDGRLNGPCTCPDLAHCTCCHAPVTNRPAAATTGLEVRLALMSSAATQKRLPRHAILDDESAIERAAESTRYALAPSEARWRDRQPDLDKRGYALRPRYSPNWKPSWLGTNLKPPFCEDAIIMEVRLISRRPECAPLTLFRL